MIHDLKLDTQLGLSMKLSFSKSMTPGTEQKVITIRMLYIIPKSKCKETMKFGQLIGCNMSIVVFDKLCKKCGIEPSLRPFYK